MATEITIYLILWADNGEIRTRVSLQPVDKETLTESAYGAKVYKIFGVPGPLTEDVHASLDATP